MTNICHLLILMVVDVQVKVYCFPILSMNKSERSVEIT